MSASRSGHPFFVYLVSLLTAIGGFLFGYDTGIVSGAMVLIKKELNLNSIWQELIISITIGMAWLFSLFAGYLTDKLGRRPVILVASVIFTVGSIVMAVAMEKWTLLVGRAIVGMGIGFASLVVPMYIAEVAPSEVRGSLVSLNQCFITAGQFVAALIAGGLSYLDHNLAWRLMLGVAALPAALQFAGFIFMPESPRWLISKGRDDQAREVLKRIRDNEETVQLEYESIRENCAAEEAKHREQGSSAGVLTKVLASSPLRKALIVGCALQAVAQASGINTVMYYSGTIIQMSGIYEETLAIWLAAAVASVNFFSSFLGPYLVERTGRRKLVLGSLFGIVISLITLAFGFQITERQSPNIVPVLSSNSTSPSSTYDECFIQTSCNGCIARPECGFCFLDQPPWEGGQCLGAGQIDTEWDLTRSVSGLCSNGTEIPRKLVWAYNWCPTSYPWITIAGLCLYLLFFGPGMGPMPWAINAEIYPSWARDTCFAISTSVNWVFNLFISLTFLSLSEAITKYGAFYLYCSFALIGLIFFYFELPETQGVSLEKVEHLFYKSAQRKSSHQLEFEGSNATIKRQHFSDPSIHVRPH